MLQVVPRADRVHRFVRDELLQQRGRRVPRDAAQREQPDVEERRDVALQLAVEIAERTIVGGEAQHVAAQVDEELHAAVEAGEQAEQRVGRRRERVAQAAFGGPAVVARAERAHRVVDRVPGRSRTR